MATDCDDRAHIGPAHVDNKIVQEVLRAATGDTLMHAPQLVQKWCKLKVQYPHHEGGYAITPTAASGLAAFYSATSRFVVFLTNLPHGGAWLHDDGQVLAHHDTWSNPQLQALVQTHARLIQEKSTGVSNGNRNEIFIFKTLSSVEYSILYRVEDSSAMLLTEGFF